LLTGSKNGAFKLFNVEKDQIQQKIHFGLVRMHKGPVTSVRARRLGDKDVVAVGEQI
jgi:hypothetical protein